MQAGQLAGLARIVREKRVADLIQDAGFCFAVETGWQVLKKLKSLSREGPSFLGLCCSRASPTWCG